MPRTLGWRDSLAAVITDDTIAYVLPSNVDVEKAPSSINIDGYATLRMERTRILADGSQVHMVDKAVRQPLNVFRDRQEQVYRAQPRQPVAAPAQPVPEAARKGVMGCLLGAAVFGAVFGAGCVMASAAWGAACIFVGALGVLCFYGALEDKLWPKPQPAEA